LGKQTSILSANHRRGLLCARRHLSLGLGRTHWIVGRAKTERSTTGMEAMGGLLARGELSGVASCTRLCPVQKMARMEYHCWNPGGNILDLCDGGRYFSMDAQWSGARHRDRRGDPFPELLGLSSLLFCDSLGNTSTYRLGSTAGCAAAQFNMNQLLITTRARSY